MRVHVINSGFGTDSGYLDVEVVSLKLDMYNRPYAIVSHPSWYGESYRAEFRDNDWVVDFD